MKARFFRKIQKPDLEKRSKLLQALCQAKLYPDLKDVRAHLRRELLKTNGYTAYFFYYKGLTIFLGYESSPKKYLMAGIDWNARLQDLKKMRAVNKVTGSKAILRHGFHQEVYVNTVAGMPTENNIYLKAAKVIRTSKAFNFKRPETTDRYVGIELEYASNIDINIVAEILAEKKLHNVVRVMRDGSIEVNSEYPHQIEICILSTIENLETTLINLKDLIENHFQANASCGFHVHLDARSGNVKQMFYNLVCMQNVLFKLASENRQDNRYCVPLSTPNFDEVDILRGSAHYDAISKFSFNKHKTIEVRIHESTKDLTTILKWVNLLTKIANYNGDIPLTFGSLYNSIKQIDNLNLAPDMLQYIREKLVS